jgi:hypothetical protein
VAVSRRFFQPPSPLSALAFSDAPRGRALRLANAAIIAARHNANITEIRVASGTYDLYATEALASDRLPGPPSTIIVPTTIFNGTPVLTFSGSAPNHTLDGVVITGRRWSLCFGGDDVLTRSAA